MINKFATYKVIEDERNEVIYNCKQSDNKEKKRTKLFTCGSEYCNFERVFKI